MTRTDPFADRPQAVRTPFRRNLRCGDVDGRPAAWIDLGAGPATPLVVLHGAGLDRAGASWGMVLSALCDGRRVLAPDLPGHGATAPLPAFRSVADLAQWLMSFLDAQGLDRVLLAGVSMGGAVALRCGLDAPDRVVAVVPVASYGLAGAAPLHGLLHAATRLPLSRLADPLIARSRLGAWLALRAIVHDPRTISAEMVAELRDIAATTSAERAFDRFLAAEIDPRGFRTTFQPELGRLRSPALFVHGRHDRTVPIAAAREASRRAGAALAELEVGHWPMFEAPGAFLRAVCPFLARHGGG